VIFNNVFANKKVFLTGHTGFKGSWLATWLTLLGAEVTGYALAPEHDEAHFQLLGLASRLRHIEADIRDEARLQAALESAAPEFVFHLAAQPLVRRSYVEPKATFDTNVGGSVNLLEAVRRVPSVRVLLYITSDKCYGHTPKPGGYREDDPLGSGDPYSTSKACAELVFSSYQSSFFRNRDGFAAASVRAGNVIGGGDWSEDRLVPDCVRALRENRPIVVRNPHAIRPWQHVLEALGGYLLLASRLYAEGRKFEGAWNFGPGLESHRPVSELVQAAIEHWGSGSMTVADGDSKRFAEAPALYLNCDKAREQLGWRPAWDFAEAIGRSVDWYREYHGERDVLDLTTSQIADYMQTCSRRSGAGVLQSSMPRSR
jgi:CDP-glucose 4,6-dehydratase